MTKVSFFTLGCRTNQAESAVLEDLLREKGFFLVEGDAPADIVVINSCTVTGEGDHEALRIINRSRRLNPLVAIAVIGCQAQVQKEKLFAIPNVRWVIGTARKMSLPDIIMDSLGAEPRLVISPVRRMTFTMPVVVGSGRRARANLKVQDGCDNSCAYCEVPFARGRARSRVFEDIMAAAKRLAEAGHKEIVLTGINVALYEDQGKSLMDVIKGVGSVKGIDRVRLSSIEYASWIRDLAVLMQPPHNLCRFLHIPVQSGSVRILRRMGRRDTSQEVACALKEIQAKVHGVMVGTDVITGFPGETEKDFEETFNFLEQHPFNYFHVFSYSDRNRARSRLFQGSVSANVVQARAMRLRQLSSRKRHAFLQGLVGQTENVLFEHKKDQHWFGHTDNYVTIKAKSGQYLRNRMVKVQVVDVEGEATIGVIL